MCTVLLRLAAALCASLCIAPLVSPLAAPLAAPLDRDCKQLAERHAERYQIALDPGRTFRQVATEGRPTELVVLGEGARPPALASAAAALLHAALRYGLGYDAALRLDDLRPCRPCNSTAHTPLWVAPAVSVEPCPTHLCSDLYKYMSRGDTRALVPLRALLARAPARCGRAPGSALPAHDAAALRACASSLTLARFALLKAELPACEFAVRNCTSDSAAHVVLTTAADGTSSREVDRLHLHICSEKLPLAFLEFKNASCFHRTLRYLEEADLSFLLLDREMYKPELLSVTLERDAIDRCPARGFNKITDLAHRVGDGVDMQTYAPQVADVVERFCPSLTHLNAILKNGPGDAPALERAACQWALRHEDTFDSWIANTRREYDIHCYVCVEGHLADEYLKVIETLNRSIANRHLDLRIHPVDELHCENITSMENRFQEIIETTPDRVMAIVARSSIEGIEAIARRAERHRVPLVLLGPAAAGTPAGPAVAAIDGTLDDLAYFYRAFLNNCGWNRIAIISDVSTYSKDFTRCLTDNYNFVYIEKTVTSETVTDTLMTLREAEARVFIVNANSAVAADVLRAAGSLGMTPPQYAWIVREWNPPAGWGPVSLFSLGTAWRGGPTGGDTGVRALLQEFWPGAAWPRLAAPLVDALLLLNSSSTVFHQLYSTNSYSMLRGGYAKSFSQIYGRIKVPGVERELSFHNGTVDTVRVYLELWRGTARTALASWDLRAGRRLRLRDESVCGPRVADRPPCSFAAGGQGFVRRCYDVPLYSALGVLLLLPIVFAAARRARLKRLAVRDLNLLAHILERKRFSSVVRGDLLCMHKKIGAGNFGNVYLATLRQSKETAISVAAKELRDESDKEEYLREAGTLQRLDHENIVKFVGICVSNGSLLILMEYAHHGDLLQYLRARRPPAADVSPRELTRLAREAAAALRYLAHCGLVHRDVRAANCLLDERRTLKLADFGLARDLCDDCEYTSIRRTVLPVLWMAPESLARGTFSTASDVWALGVLLVELVTLGERPYGARPPHQVLAYVRLGGRPPLPPDASLQTVSLATACWQFHAAERATAGEIERYLAAETAALRPALRPAPDIELTDPTVVE